MPHPVSLNWDTDTCKTSIPEASCCLLFWKLLEHITSIDNPGVFSCEKQRIECSSDFTGITSWFADKSDLIHLFDPQKLHISDEFKRVIASLCRHHKKKCGTEQGRPSWHSACIVFCCNLFVWAVLSITVNVFMCTWWYESQSPLISYQCPQLLIIVQAESKISSVTSWSQVNNFTHPLPKSVLSHVKPAGIKYQPSIAKLIRSAETLCSHQWLVTCV